ncbi:MAG TPA: MltA domain-containing protein [Candidatus Acidoferrum sp.]|nr:MltA domain-containing protein [Candidatus Acidoferrum sp.]
MIAGLWLGIVLLGAGLWPDSASADPRAALRPVTGSETPALLDTGDYASLREAIIQSLAWLTRRPPRSTFVFGARTVTAGEQARALERVLGFLADDPAPDVLEAFLLEEFDVVRSVGSGDGTMLVTGYHEVTLDAALERSAEYHVPILAAPVDLPAHSPIATSYPTRAEIQAGRLNGRTGALAWARSAIDVFFMEVEGSGTLRLTDGRDLSVGYAGTNGRPYRSIARLLIDEGHIDRDAMSMRALREWLTANPDQLARVLNHNQSYVFFGRRNGPPVGSLGVPLTPGRSIATDPKIFPPGSLAFLLTERPRQTAGGDVDWSPVSRFVLSQDVGGAIRGPSRVDVFWGRGPDADLAASEMKQPGELYVLVPKPPGIRPLSPAKPAPTVDLPATAQSPALDAQTPGTERPTPDVAAREDVAETRVAEAGVRAIVESQTVGAESD